MDASDLLITKPGGMTCTEGQAKGIPMLFYNAIPGQEEKNSQYFVELGLAEMLNPGVVDKWFSMLLSEYAGFGDRRSARPLRTSSSRSTAPPPFLRCWASQLRKRSSPRRGVPLRPKYGAKKPSMSHLKRVTLPEPQRASNPTLSLDLEALLYGADKTEKLTISSSWLQLPLRPYGRNNIDV